MTKEEIPNYLNEVADYARRQVEELLSVIKKYDDYSEEQIEELRTHLMSMFLEGTVWQNKQMMKKVVEGEFENEFIGIVNFNTDFTKYGYSACDKVRVFILKKEERNDTTL